jgi:hypothetical protein
LTTASIISLGVGGVNILAIIIALSRGIISKGDCSTCNTDIHTKFNDNKKVTDSKFESGKAEFAEVQSTLKEQGEELAAQGATIDAIDSNVGRLVDHHLGKNG